MEGGGFLEAADINALVSAGVVRGISDLLSGKTAEDQSGSQELAADAASAAVFEILHGLAPPPKSGQKPGKKPSKQWPVIFLTAAVGDETMRSRGRAGKVHARVNKAHGRAP